MEKASPHQSNLQIKQCFQCEIRDDLLQEIQRVRRIDAHKECQISRLIEAIEWVCDINGEFDNTKFGAVGRYWWREILLEKAGLEVSPINGEEHLKLKY